MKVKAFCKFVLGSMGLSVLIGAAVITGGGIAAILIPMAFAAGAIALGGGVGASIAFGQEWNGKRGQKGRSDQHKTTVKSLHTHAAVKDVLSSKSYQQSTLKARASASESSDTNQLVIKSARPKVKIRRRVRVADQSPRPLTCRV